VVFAANWHQQYKTVECSCQTSK